MTPQRAVKVAVKENFGAVKGPPGAVVFSISGREGLPGSGNPACACAAINYEEPIG